MHAMQNQHATAEKHSAAASSVLAAVFLTALKIVVGLITNSLGILAEAAHSGLDLVAALVTWFSVRTSDQPPDREHHYGHGKIENLSALFETLLLLATCGWIIYEAVDRLIVQPEPVEASLWAFLIMGTSIVVDFGRSRVLRRAAVKYNSQALEADALHFSTDIWSSAVVILGLFGVLIAERSPTYAFLIHADAIAALGVAAIVIVISIRLGRRCISALLDTAPSGLDRKIQRAAESVSGVEGIHYLRIRTSGPRIFVDMHATFRGERSLEDVHTRSEAIERAVREVAPDADVTVHMEPHAAPDDDQQAE